MAGPTILMGGRQGVRRCSGSVRVIGSNCSAAVEGQQLRSAAAAGKMKNDRATVTGRARSRICAAPAGAQGPRVCPRRSLPTHAWRSGLRPTSRATPGARAPQRPTMLPLRSKRTSESGSWEDNAAAAECSNCSKAFTLLLRRHHCRVCGKCFCNGCTSFRVRLASSRTGKEKRACAQCFAVSGAGGGYEPLVAPARAPSKSIVVAVGSGVELDLSTGGGRRTAAQLGRLSAEGALAELRKPLGCYNWALFRPTATLQALQLHDAGSLSVNGAWGVGGSGPPPPLLAGHPLALLLHTHSLALARTHHTRTHAHTRTQSASNSSRAGRRTMACCGWALGRGASGAPRPSSSPGCPRACPRWQCRSGGAWQSARATWQKSWGPLAWSCR
jgi:hypothetical protein